MARILVTGGAGYIGSVCCDQLLRAGHTVTVLDDLSTGHRDAVPEGARFLAAALGDAPTLRAALHGQDAVFHFAAKALIPESLRDPEAFYDANLGQGLALLSAMRAEGVRRIVFSSSAAVYGHCPRSPIQEDEVLRPINPYGETKLAFERALDWYAQAYGWTAVAFRYFSAAGAAGGRGERHLPETHVLPLLLAGAAGKGPEFQIYGEDYPTADGTCERDFVHVADISAAHVLALAAQLSPGLHVYNLGGGAAVSVRALCGLAEEITGHKIPHRVGPRRPGDPPRLCAAADKVRRELGWRPQHDLRQMVASAWEWSQASADRMGPAAAAVLHG